MIKKGDKCISEPSVALTDKEIAFLIEPEMTSVPEGVLWRSRVFERVRGDPSAPAPFRVKRYIYESSFNKILL